MKILMVCLGNICRSPLAEGILKAKITHQNITVDSAGTSSLHQGENPDARAVITARKHNVNIAKQTSRPFVVEDFDRFDLIYVMDASNKSNVLKLARNKSDEEKVKLIVNEVYPGSDGEVPDPYFGGDAGFEDVYKLLDEATDKILEKHTHGE